MTSSAKKGGFGLQWQMLIGFLVGLVARPDRLFDAARRRLGRDRHDLCDAADRADLPAPAVHAGHSAAVLGAGRRHFRDGRDPLAEARRPADLGLYGRRLGDRGRGQPCGRQPAASPAPASTGRPPQQMLAAIGRAAPARSSRPAPSSRRASTPSSASSPTTSSR